MTQSELTVDHLKVNRQKNQTFIYALIDPRTGNPFYVGKTNDLNLRLRRHVEFAKRWKEWKNNGSPEGGRLWGTNNSIKNSRICEILDGGAIPKCKLLERCKIRVGDIEIWRRRECWWYNKLLKEGYVLTNGAECGAGGGDLTKETKLAISKALKASESARRHNESRRGIPLTKGHREAVSIGQRNSVKCKNYHLMQIGAKRPHEFGKRLSIVLKASLKLKAAHAAMKGQKRPQVAATHKGVRETEKTKAAISSGLRNSGKFQNAMKARRGKPLSESHKAAKLASQLEWWRLIYELEESGKTREEARVIARQIRGRRPSRN